MKKQMRDITFVRIHYTHIEEYTLRCTRSWWNCFKFGWKHIKQGKATIFFIKKVKPKKL